MRKVRIKGLPKGKDGGANQESGANVGLQRFMSGTKKFDNGLNQFAQPDIEVNKSISAVPREQANIEAEHNEQVVVPGLGGIPESYTVKGQRHANGGVPLNLEQDSFIFSDHKKEMKIKDKEILEEFGTKPGKGKHKGKTPAQLAKKFDINEYKKILMDPDTDKMERETAEQMIKNYNMKLGKLALVQESMKGFPQNIPAIAKPYLEMIGQNTEMGPQGMPAEAAYGAGVIGDPSQFAYKYGGENSKMAKRFPGLDVARDGIHIDPTHKGDFTAKANAAGMSVQEFASHVLSAPEGHYSPSTRKQANFARNASKWKHQDGGPFDGAFWQSIMAVGGEPEINLNGVFAGDTHVFGDSKTEPPAEEQPKTSDKPTKSSNIPAEKKKSANDPNLQVGDYYQEGGKWYKVTYVPTQKTYTGSDLNTTFAGNQDVAGAYGFLEQTFNDPAVKAEFAANTRAALKNKEYYKGKSGKYSEMYDSEQIDNMTDDQIVQHFLTGQKRNYALQAMGIDPKDFSDANGTLRKDLPQDKKDFYKGLGVSTLNQGFEKAGVPITQENVSAGDIGLQQGTYWGYHDLLANRENLSPELQDKLQYFHEPQEGFSDEPIGTISPIDSKSKNFWTNTSAGQLAVIKDPMRSEQTEEIITETPAKATGDIPTNEFKPVTHVPRDEWWAQDIGNIANLFGQRVGLKKYLPHSAPVDLARPDVLYYDPSRALAANAEQQQMMANLLRGSGNSQQRAAQMSGITGQGFANAANILADYEAKNVGVGNQYLQQVQATENQERMANADRMTKLYDQNTIANQQFDNAKRAADRNLFEAWRQGLTNKKQTQALNALYPQFETIPSIGGGLYFTGVPHSPFVNTGSAGTSSAGYLDDFTKLKRQFPDASDSAIEKELEYQYGNSKKAPLAKDPRAAAFFDAYTSIGARGAYPPSMYPNQ